MKFNYLHLVSTIILLLGLMLSTNLIAQNKTSKLPIAQTIERVLGTKAKYFECQLVQKSVDPDEFTIESKNGKIILTGTTQPAIGYAFNYYLTRYCHCQVSHVGENFDLPDPLPSVHQKITVKSPYKYRYYYNYCTYNYAKSFWGWDQWQNEIDWLVLHGINMPLAIIGTEAVWQNTLKQFGLSDVTIKRFIPGPTYTAWWLMGNLEGWGGPVSQAWINQQVRLQKQIISRMRELGMTPVFQGFYGMVPDTLRTIFSKSKIYYGGLWAGDTEGFRRPAFLDPSDPLFAQMAGTYYKELEKLYGKTTFYGGDPFHEGGNTEGIDITASARLIQKSMLQANPEAIWALQGWWDNPTDKLLDGVDKNHTMVLDLYAEGNPQWENRKGFNGISWIWCSLTNFGGKVGIYSRIDKIAAEPARALHSEYGANLKGIGMMMEGDKTNPINSELTFDASWSDQAINLDQWVDNFADARYSSKNIDARQAWQIIRQTALNCPKAQEGTSESIFCCRGDFDVTKAWEYGFINIYYPQEKLQEALRLLLSCSDELKSKDTYQYDVVDVERQVLSNYAYSVYQQMMDAYNKKETALFKQKTALFLQLINDQDLLLSTRKEFLLGNWLEAAKKNATSAQESHLFEQDARTLITLWGDEGVSKTLHEYANREWSGMVGGLYKMRWQTFINVLNDRMNGKATPMPDYYTMENNWTHSRTSYPTITAGDPVKTAQELFAKYFASK